MAFLGGIGKALGITTQEAAGIGSAFASGGLFSGIAAGVGALGDGPRIPSTVPVDVTARPSGVDSPATVSQVSQTSQLPIPMGFDSREQFLNAGRQLPQVSTAGFGIPGLVTGVARQLTKPGVGGLIGGVAAGAGIETVVDMFGREKKLVITRKLQRDVKKVFMLSGGNIGFVSANSMRLFGKSLSEGQVLEVLFKTFSNQSDDVKRTSRLTSLTQHNTPGFITRVKINFEGSSRLPRTCSSFPIRNNHHNKIQGTIDEPSSSSMCIFVGGIAGEFCALLQVLTKRSRFLGILRSKELA